jgi:hypothetical protein
LGTEHEVRPLLLKLWARVSVPALLGCIVVALLAPPLALVTTIAVFSAAFMGVEALARRRFVSFVVNLFLLLAALALLAVVVVLFLDHWRVAISVVIGLAALVLLIGNVLRG